MNGKWPLKVVCVGDAGVGKTCLIHWAVSRKFLEQCRATVYAGFEKLTIGEPRNETTLELWETAGQGVYGWFVAVLQASERGGLCLRPQAPESMAGLALYRDAMAQVCPDCVIAFVGNKVDLADSRRVAFDEGFEFMRKVGAVFSTECSAKTGVGVGDLFKFIAKRAAVSAEPTQTV